ncbi:hypothetical protein [Pirellula sp. SH-Sr6A]|uniref:hypothetical protein n=1 Tax=Pirellula sp. SH-Sr6A TaxID=1632865 RepID=UPI00143A9F12|nr:hypothetical protein [Pirellula sp. SH-Sr6A]
MENLPFNQVFDLLAYLAPLALSNPFSEHIGERRKEQAPDKEPGGYSKAHK